MVLLLCLMGCSIFFGLYIISQHQTKSHLHHLSLFFAACGLTTHTRMLSKSRAKEVGGVHIISYDVFTPLVLGLRHVRDTACLCTNTKHDPIIVYVLASYSRQGLKGESLTGVYQSRASRRFFNSVVG